MLEVPYLQPNGFIQDRAKIKECICEVAASDEFILKRNVVTLESRICEMIGAQHAIGVSSGTGAMVVALKAFDIQPGDRVITAAYGFSSPANSIIRAGGIPHFVDVDADTGVLDVDQIAERLSDRVKLIVPAHLCAQMADMPRIRLLADQYGVAVLEDSAVALGAMRDGRAAGLWGDVGVYSFWSAKPCGGIGEAGMIVTNDERLGRLCRMLRNHGQDGITRFLHHVIGFNHRMDEIQAAYLLHKLDHFPDLLRQRAALAQRYDIGLAHLTPHVVLPPMPMYERAVYTYAIQVERRDTLKSFLDERGIQTKPGYVPLPSQSAFSFLGHRQGEFPQAERVSSRTLLLPLYPEIPDPHIDYVIETISEFYRRHA